MRFIAVFIALISAQHLFAQNLTLPYTFKNESRYADNEIYIGLVGTFETMGPVWMDLSKSELKVQGPTYNTLKGPSFGIAPNGKDLFADMFFKLSDIPNKTIQIPYGLMACRIFVSFKTPMYIYFHPTGGFAAANLDNPDDPNDGIRWELVELSWAGSGLFTNTSRVDAYQYPMAIEVKGFRDGTLKANYLETYKAAIKGETGAKVDNKKVGELMSHKAILDKWLANVSTPFANCKHIRKHSMDGEPIIEQPSKTTDFSETGIQKDYFQAYIDDIWATYRAKDLYFNIGDRGTWKGRVTGDQFNFTSPTGVPATIYTKPNTQHAIEGRGALATTPATGERGTMDAMIQAQMAAAINRHTIYTDAAEGEVQMNNDATRFFKKAPYNDYVSFLHDPLISYNGRTYAFSYDDVGDYSSTIQVTYPTDATVIIGGYGEKNAAINPFTFNRKDSFQLWANSTSHIISFSRPIQSGTLMLLNSSGVSVWKGKVNGVSVKTPTALVSGLYIWTIVEGSRTFSGKVNVLQE